MTKKVYLPAPRNELMALVLHASLTSLERCYGNFRLRADLSARLVECLLSPLHACVEQVGRRRLFHGGHAVTFHGQDIRADFFAYRLALPERCRRHRWYEKKKCASNRDELHRFDQLIQMKNELRTASILKFRNVGIDSGFGGSQRVGQILKYVSVCLSLFLNSTPEI